MAKFISHRKGFINVDLMTTISLIIQEAFVGFVDGHRKTELVFRAEGYVTTSNKFGEVIVTEWRKSLDEVNQEVLDKWGHTVLFVSSDIPEIMGK